MLQVLGSLRMSLKRNCYGQALPCSQHREHACRFQSTPLPNTGLCKGSLWTLHVTPARMEKDQVQLCLQVATLEKADFLGRGRREPILHCLPALGPSLGITSPSTSGSHHGCCQGCFMWPAGHGDLQKGSAYACSQLRAIQFSLVF